MSFVPVSSGRVGIASALCAVLALASHAASAQPTSPAAAGGVNGGVADAASHAGAPAGPLTVWIDAADTSFDKARLQASLEQELGQKVVFTDDAAAAAVQIRLEGASRADVHYTTPGGEELSRSVDLPPDRERSVQVVSWLTVNLVRDEASELLDELRARKKAEAEAREAADKAAADKTAADKAAAEKLAREAEQAKKNQKAQGARPAADDVLLRDPLRSVDAAVATPLSVLRDSPRRELKLQLALGYGESGALRGLGFSLGVLRVRRDLLGIGVGLGATLIGGSARGLVASVGYSEVDGKLEGIQLGVGAAWQRGPVARGAVLAGGGAFVGNMNGIVAAGGVTGAKSLQGIEIAGGVNTATSLDGIALAPVNVHGRVRGLQLGIVNVADEVDGVAIGILSFAKNGRVQPVLWTGTDRAVHVAIKSIAGYAFTQLGGGIDLNGANFGYDAGIGAHLKLSPSWFFEPGIHYSSSQRTVDAAGGLQGQQLHYLAQVGLRLGDKVDLLLAAGARQNVVGGSGATVAPELRVGLGLF